MKQNIFVTGGFGFIGSSLCEILAKKGYRVILIDKLGIGSNRENIKEKKNIIFYKNDISNYNFIKKLVYKYRPIAFFNLAAETHVDRSIDNPETFIKSNIIGVYNLLEILRKEKFYKKNFKFIHVSTDEVYGDIKKKNKSKEGDAYNPSSPYASSKASGDLLIKSYYRTYNIPAIITNCTNNFGPKQYPEKLIPRVILNILNNKNIPIYGNGENEREWIFVNEHCENLFKIFKKGKIGESYNIGSGIVLKNIDLVKKIFSIFRKLKIKSSSKIVYVKDRPGHDFRYSLNSNKIKRELKIITKNNFNSQLTTTVKWYINNKKWLANIKNKRYKKRIGLGK